MSAEIREGGKLLTLTTHILGPDAFLYHADCREALKHLPDNCIDSVVTDPPYHLTSVVKRFGSPNAAPAQYGTDGAFSRASAGFMGKKWDGGDIAFRPETWAEVLRVLKPGGHICVFGGTRTAHRMVCAIEDAGFEIRDSLAWMYGTGFPKSHDVSKGIDQELGAEREITHEAISQYRPGEAISHDQRSSWERERRDIPATTQAAEWQGWGTALKPAIEPICLARKPLDKDCGTIATNVLRWGTGAINIDRCRIRTTDIIQTSRNVALGSSSGGIYGTATMPGTFEGHELGRWPANILHDGSDEVVGAFPSSGPSKARLGKRTTGNRTLFFGLGAQDLVQMGHDDPGGNAARFFYHAKASKADRAGSKHPTIKPIDLIAYLCRLITPSNGVVLDPFAGSGTLFAAARREGFKAILIERETEYIADILNRVGVDNQRALVKSEGQEEAA